MNNYKSFFTVQPGLNFPTNLFKFKWLKTRLFRKNMFPNRICNFIDLTLFSRDQQTFTLDSFLYSIRHTKCAIRAIFFLAKIKQEKS